MSAKAAPRGVLLVAAVEAASWIVRVVDEDEFRARGGGSDGLCQVDGKMVERDRHRFCPHRLDRQFIDQEGRRRQDHLVLRYQKGANDKLDDLV